MTGSMRAFEIVYVLVFSVHIWSICTQDDEGFNLFFESNLDEYQDHEITFSNATPIWLRGTLIRNGLGRFELGPRHFVHAFDAYGKLASWRFSPNGSYFSTRMIHSKSYNTSVQLVDVAPYLMFETVAPAFDYVQKKEQLLRGIDNMNVNVRKFKGDRGNDAFVALNDFWMIYEFNPQTLETIKPVTPRVPAAAKTTSFSFLSFLSSAHPLPQAGTSNWFTFLSTVSIIPDVKSKISVIRITSVREREVVGVIEVDRVPYMHSFSVTRNYVILFAHPFYVNVTKMIATSEPFLSLDWYADKDTTVYVVHIDSGNVTKVTAPNVFIMHHINAFELDSGEIIVDIATYPNPNFMKNMTVDNLTNSTKRNSIESQAMLRRYVINMVSQKVNVVTFQTTPGMNFVNWFDLPTINENYRHKSYCYAYGVVLKMDQNILSNIAIVKKNLCKPGQDKFWHLQNHYPMEAWFVARPDATYEDDGVLLVPVLDGANARSYLAVLNATTMELSSAAYLPTIVPFSFHGQFYNDL